jgi:hypothetical protein
MGGTSIMAIFDNIVGDNINFKGYTGNPPTTEAEYDALDCWTDKSKAPSWASVSSDMTLERVKKDRKESYPSVGDQLDMIYNDMKNSTTAHADAVEAIKAKYPKPE